MQLTLAYHPVTEIHFGPQTCLDGTTLVIDPEELRQVVLRSGGELLHAADVFDLYEGEQVGEGRKSLALRLEFRAADPPDSAPGRR